MISLENPELVKMRKELEYIVGPIPLKVEHFKTFIMNIESAEEYATLMEKYGSEEEMALSRKKQYLYETIISAIPQTQKLSKLQYDTLINFHKIILEKQ